MEIDTFIEIINANPACYFVVGLILGYFLRGTFSHGVVSEFRNKRPSRYQTKKIDPVKRSSIVADLAEPSFDWSDAAAKTIIARQKQKLGSNIPLESQINEF
jgi:hypothetical protein